MQSPAEALNDMTQIAHVFLDHAPKFVRRRMFLVRFSVRRWFFVAGRHSLTVLPRGKRKLDLAQALQLDARFPAMGRNRTWGMAAACPLWVRDRHQTLEPRCLLYSPKADIRRRPSMSAMCQQQTYAPVVALSQIGCFSSNREAFRCGIVFRVPETDVESSGFQAIGDLVDRSQLSPPYAMARKCRTFAGRSD